MGSKAKILGNNTKYVQWFKKLGVSENPIITQVIAANGTNEALSETISKMPNTHTLFKYPILNQIIFEKLLSDSGDNNVDLLKAFLTQPKFVDAVVANINNILSQFLQIQLLEGSLTKFEKIKAILEKVLVKDGVHIVDIAENFRFLKISMLASAPIESLTILIERIEAPADATQFLKQFLDFFEELNNVKGMLYKDNRDNLTTLSDRLLAKYKALGGSDNSAGDNCTAIKNFAAIALAVKEIEEIEESKKLEKDSDHDASNKNDPAINAGGKGNSTDIPAINADGNKNPIIVPKDIPNTPVDINHLTWIQNPFGVEYATLMTKRPSLEVKAIDKMLNEAMYKEKPSGSASEFSSFFMPPVTTENKTLGDLFTQLGKVEYEVNNRNFKKGFQLDALAYKVGVYLAYMQNSDNPCIIFDGKEENKLTKVIFKKDLPTSIESIKSSSLSIMDIFQITDDQSYVGDNGQCAHSGFTYQRDTVSGGGSTDAIDMAGLYLRFYEDFSVSLQGF